MRIAIVTQSFHPRMGGLSEHVAHSARQMLQRGHSVTVITGRPRGMVVGDSDVACIRLGTNVPVPMLGGISDLAVGRGLRRELSELLVPERFDLAHIHSPLVPTLPLFAVEESQIPVLGHFHSYARGHRLLEACRPLLQRAYRRLDRRVAVSPAARAFVGRYFDSTGMGLVPTGVDLEHFRPGIAPYDRLRDGKLNLLFVGRLEPRKGLHVLLDALRELNLGDRVRLMVVGNGPLRQPLRALSRFARCEVLFFWEVTAELLPRVYASADLFCAPATGNESLGVVLLEALASGLPVVATDIPGYRYVLRDGQDGALVPGPHAATWARTLKHLIENEEARATYAARARARARAFEWSSIADLLEDEYRLVCGQLPTHIPERTVLESQVS